MGCHFLLQGNFLTQGLNPGFPRYRQMLYCLSHKGSPFPFLPFYTVHGVLKARILKWFAIPFCSGPSFVRTPTMAHLSWVALHGMSHSFFELDKTVVHVISLISFL